MLSGIHSGAQRLHEIVESMLDMAIIDTRELQLDLQPVSLGDLIDALHKQLESALKERNQKFEAVNLAHLPAIQGDREALLKVFYHLLVNAIKYTPNGGKITVSGKAVCATDEQPVESGVELVVSDTGIGIDPGMQEVIFTKFYQTGELALHSSGRTKFKGAGPGLGLAIAKGIVEVHSGRIWVESPEHDEIRCPGSQFYVYLPVNQPERRGEQPAP
jgi:signal transduction histidine kinase